METLTGVVDSIIFNNEDNGFLVFRLRPESGASPVTVAGTWTVPLVGEELRIVGSWVEHKRFGRQFQGQSFQRLAPTTEKGIERFLSSGAIKGLGPALAARLVSHFGKRTLDVLEHFPHRLREVPGIGAKKAKQIADSFSSQGEMREIMLFLEMHGVSGSYATRIVKTYSSAALEVLREQPYRLADEVEGIGFRTADHIAQGLGLAGNHPERLQAGIRYALARISQSGHCCVPEEALIGEASKLLGAQRLEIADAMREMIGNQDLLTEDYSGQTLIYPPWLYQAECYTARRIQELQAKADELEQAEYEERIGRWEEREDIQLAGQQREAVLAALTHGILVITGGPGTGKTTIVKCILAMLEEAGLEIELAAPTGRAAKRLGEATGRKASTLHRLLEAGGSGGKEGNLQFARSEEQPLEVQAVIVDETSMMDIQLSRSLLAALPDGCRLILVGDVDQLPAVGAGQVLTDLIRSQTVPVVRLTEIFRQEKESMIICNAHRINRGQMPELNVQDDFLFLEADTGEEAARKVLDLCREQLPAEGFDPMEEVQVLSPMHRYEGGVEHLNRLLQEAMNPPSIMKEEIELARTLFRTGDKVMQRKNNYNKKVFNGDMGSIIAIGQGRVYVRYPDTPAEYEKGELDELQPAFAMTVHKSQGSEYPVVVLVLLTSHYIMLQRNLLYTAVTRAKSKVILVGSRRALETALHNDRTRKRYTLLAERLRGSLE